MARPKVTTRKLTLNEAEVQALGMAIRQALPAWTHAAMLYRAAANGSMFHSKLADSSEARNAAIQGVLDRLGWEAK